MVDSGIAAVEFMSFDSGFGDFGGEEGAGVEEREGMGMGGGIREGKRKSRSRAAFFGVDE